MTLARHINFEIGTSQFFGYLRCGALHREPVGAAGMISAIGLHGREATDAGNRHKGARGTGGEAKSVQREAHGRNRINS